MEDVVGNQVRQGEQTVNIEEVLGSGAEFFGIYFGAHWAPPCRLFTPALSEFYNKINAGCDNGQRRIEIFFCSIDGN